MATRDEIIEKVRGCLALGDKARNPNENEAETAVRMARMLMEKHNLSMADIVEKEGKLSEEIREQQMVERSGAPNWEYDLSLVCKYLFGVQSFVRIGRPSYHKSVVFIGYETDVALAVEVYKLLKLELMGMGLRWSNENPSPQLTPKQALVRRFKYLDGVVIALIRRAKEQSALAAADANKVRALVVVKDAGISKFMERYKLGTSARRGSNAHMDAVTSGIADGKKVSMNFKDAIKGEASTARPELSLNK